MTAIGGLPLAGPLFPVGDRDAAVALGGFSEGQRVEDGAFEEEVDSFQEQ